MLPYCLLRMHGFLSILFVAVLMFIPVSFAQDTGDLGFLTGEENVPVPEMDKLFSPETSVDQLFIQVIDKVNEQPVSSVDPLAAIPALPEKDEVDENIFFDAESLIPTGEMGVKSGPRKVNPSLQPGLKLIVVKKSYEAGSKKASLVAAERAMKLGRYAAALDMYNNLYQENKHDLNVVMGRAMALQKLNRDEEAVFVYEELLAQPPENINAKVNMLGLIGQRYPAVALQRLLDIREGNSYHVGVVAQIAVVQANLGRYNEALQYLGIASSMEPNNAGHIFNIAVIADKAGNKKEAIRYYEQALEVDTIYGGSRSIPRDSIFERLANLR